MNFIIVVSACVILGLVVLAKIPGLEHTVRPLIDLVFTGIKVALENSVSWSIFLFKLLWGSHMELAQHLMMTPEQIDPSYEMKKKAT